MIRYRKAQEMHAKDPKTKATEAIYWDNVQEINRQHPGTFDTPSPGRLARLKSGDLVRIQGYIIRFVEGPMEGECLECVVVSVKKNTVDPMSGVPGHRMRNSAIKVRVVKKPSFLPRKLGDVITVRKYNIYDLISKAVHRKKKAA